MNSHRYRRTWLPLLACLAFTPLASAQEQLPPNAKVVKLEAQPNTIELKNPFDYRQLLLTARLENGEIIDATRMAQWDVPAIVKTSPNMIVRPNADGSGSLKATLGGQSLTIPITVAGAKAKYPISYVRDVMPAMSKMGCNSGTCHGAADGKNGFKLSLRGYDPIFDYRSLTDDLEGRRFDRAAPDRSLMLLKPTGEVPHVGGVLCNVGDPHYELLRLWIADGVKFDPQSPRVASITVTPQGPSVPVIGLKQQMAVIAKYTDGTVRDVTAEAFIESSNAEVATVDKNGLVTTVRRGESTMLARYEGAYAASTIVVMGDRSGFVWNNPPEYNFVDTLVHDKLKKVKVQPSDICTDSEFIRRVYIDLTGLPPGPDEVRAFLADNRDNRAKREQLVDKLVGSEAFIDHWTNKWADLMQVNRKFLGEQGAQSLRGWIRNAIAMNMPYDKFAYAILTASGSNVENPPAGYFKVLRDADAVMENTTQLFLAVRFNCNKCHDHPFERWTQDQYYQMAAYFAQVQRTEDPKFKGQKIGGSAVEGAVPLVEVIVDAKGGDVKHGRTGIVTPPKFPYPHEDLAAATESRRVQVAKWVTSPKNQYFAKSYVNRVWAYLLGVGMIEPIDDIRAGNPPSNPALLDRLTQEFVAGGFNVQQLMKTICKSRTYQLSIHTNQWNQGDDLNYSHAIARRLPAEVLYDAIHKATGAPSRIPGMPPTARAAQIIDSSVELPGGFLDLFGKPVRESACECERSGSMMLGPVLAMVNGPVLGDALKDPSNRLAQLVAKEKDDGKIVEELFLAVLNRFPTPQEIASGKQALHGAKPDYDQIVADYQKKLAAFQTYEKQLDARLAAWEVEMKKQPNWTVLEPTAFKSKIGAEIKKEGDQSLFVSGKNDAFDVYTVTAPTKITGITGIRLELLTDDRLPAKGPGRAQNGNLVLNEFKVSAAPANDAKKSAGIALHKAVADFAQDSFPVGNAIDGNVGTGWALSPQLGKSHVAIFETTTPLGGPEGTILSFSLDQRYQDKMHTIGRFRLSVTTDQQPRLNDGGVPARIKELLAIDAAKRTPEQKAELLNYHRGLDGEYNRLRGTIAQTPPSDHRLMGAQDLVWALINNPAFLFNH